MIDLRDIVEFIKDVSKYLIVIIVVLLITIYVVSLQQVIGPSMKPNLNDGDILLLNKFNYRLFSVKRNDVIAFNHDETKYLVKRVIGLPGETIAYENNILYIDGKPYQENIGKDIITNDFDFEILGYDVVPDNMYFVLGDNRSDSMDSRDFGFVKKEDIIGKAFIRIWPLNGLKLIK